MALGGFLELRMRRRREPSRSASLLALSRAEQEVAKRAFTASRLAHVGTLAVSLTTLFATGTLAYYLALGALLTEVGAWILRFRGDRRHWLAEQGRRRALLADALGTATERLALRDLRASFSRRAERLASDWEDSNYYAADEDPGLARLSSEMQESAFWSRRLYRLAWHLSLVMAVALLVLVIVALFIVIGAGSSNASLQVARVGVIFLSFLVFSDLLTQAIAWWDASQKSEEVYRRLDTELGEMATALAVFGDYCVATATTPPIPTMLYRFEGPRIEKAWRETSA
jgi:ABC-type multidrug transport system fused ATPase/permease subunit